jgi:hypothetical protein
VTAGIKRLQAAAWRSNKGLPKVRISPEDKELTRTSWATTLDGTSVFTRVSNYA